MLNNQTLKSTCINFKHTACTKIIPLTDEKIILIGFDRLFYQYELQGETWELTKTSFDRYVEKKDDETKTSEVSNSIFDRMKKFDTSHQIQKKSSVFVGGKSNETDKSKHIIHSANISGISIKSEDCLVTSDFAGFIKDWTL